MGKLSQEELEMVYKQGEAQRVPGPQVMVQDIEVIEVDIDGRTFWVRFPETFLHWNLWKMNG